MLVNISWNLVETKIPIDTVKRNSKAAMEWEKIQWAMATDIMQPFFALKHTNLRAKNLRKFFNNFAFSLIIFMPVFLTWDEFYSLTFSLLQCRRLFIHFIFTLLKSFSHPLCVCVCVCERVYMCTCAFWL